MPTDIIFNTATHTLPVGREMLKANIRAISCVLKEWGEYGKERYYYDNWRRFLDDADVAEYRYIHGFDPEDRSRGIKVFFDNEGYLQIRNCDVPSIRRKIERGMEGFSEWAVERSKGMCISNVEVGKLAVGCAEKVKPGIYRIASSKRSVLVGHELLSELIGYSAIYYPRADIMEIDTGSKALDKVLEEIFHEKGLHWKDYIPMTETIDIMFREKMWVYKFDPEPAFKPDYLFPE